MDSDRWGTPMPWAFKYVHFVNRVPQSHLDALNMTRSEYVDHSSVGD